MKIDTQREHLVKMEAKAGATFPHSREHLEVGRGRKKPPLEASEGAGPCHPLNFRLSASRTLTE